MLVWKHTYPPIQSSTAESPDGDSPWISWGRPPGGFIDLGCGNGLLVHILVSSGYTNGIGIDLRERKSWSHYPTSTQARLKIYPLDPTSSSSLDPTIFRFNSFIVGNHSDELTPWLPIIATLTSSSFLSIPCCPWTLDSKFTKPKGFHKRKDQTEAEQEFERKLEAAGGKTTLYATYLLWLFRQGLECGFEVETECLRIPSTRNWAFLCRRRLNPDHTKEQERYLTHVQSLVEQVKTRGIFKPRTPEGKAGRDH
ncbi:tRNA(Ser) Um(44) 2'-O-methyltransferase [Tulasnella sp. 419]|nr:tRNA(Ser) Um(44) 2'-O-methyltransferase [Tulasnella sp. 419]